jgi:hypothetical protein
MADAPTLLGPNPDLEDVDLIRAVEAAFEVRLTNAEVEQIHTVGDLHSVLIGKLQHVERGVDPVPHRDSLPAIEASNRSCATRNKGSSIDGAGAVYRTEAA